MVNKQNFKTENQTENVSDSLTNIVLETPNLKNDNKLAKFYLWTKEDPLFTSPSFNSEAFSGVVDSLKMEESAYLKLLKVNDKIFPIPFLKDVIEVNNIYKDFLENPTRNKAEELIKAYYKIEADYAKDQTLLLKTLERNNTLHPNTFYISLNSSTSLNVIYNDVKRLGQNAEELKKEIGERQECLEKGNNCKRPALFFSNPTLVEDTSSFSQKDFLPMDMLRLSFLSKNVSTFGPYIVSTPCFGSTSQSKNPSYPFYIFEDREERNFLVSGEKFETQIPKLAITNYYRKVHKESGANDSFLAKRNLDFVLHMESNIYVCNNSSFKNTLATLDKFYREYKNDPLYAGVLKLNDLDSEPKKIITEGDILEKKLFNSQFPSETAAGNLVNYYAYTYKSIITWVNDPKYKEKAWKKELFNNRDKFLNRYLEYSRQLGNYDEVLAAALGNLSSLRIKALLYSVDSASYAYVFRNMYGLVYFPFSYSFYRLDTPLSYLDDKPVVNAMGLDKTYMTYQQALQKYSKEELKKWNVDQILFLEEDFQKSKK